MEKYTYFDVNKIYTKNYNNSNNNYMNNNRNERNNNFMRNNRDDDNYFHSIY